MWQTSLLGMAFAAAVTGLGAPSPSSGSAPARAERAAQDQRGDTATARFAVSGMTCGSCATTARVALRRLRGVHEAIVSYDSASAVVRYDPRQVSPGDIAAHLLRMTGYRATLSAESTAARPVPRRS